MVELQKLMNDVAKWSDETFGKGNRTKGILRHLQEEIDEVIEEVDKSNALGVDNSVGVGEFGRQVERTQMEFADCFMLLIDAAAHYGITAEELLRVTRKKLEINKNRDWDEMNEDGFCNHIPD